MADGVLRQNWDHTSLLAALLFNPNRPKDVEPKTPADFNPFAPKPKPQKVPISSLREMFKGIAEGA